MKSNLWVGQNSKYIGSNGKTFFYFFMKLQLYEACNIAIFRFNLGQIKAPLYIWNPVTYYMTGNILNNLCYQISNIGHIPLTVIGN